MERELPSINLNGIDFIVDVNKLELREKADPTHIIRIKDMEDTGEGYRHDNLEIPEFIKMDPVGMALKYLSHKTDFDLMVDQEAFYNRAYKGMLPTLDIEGHIFYVDLKMDMLRPHDDFGSMGIVFSEIDEYFLEDENVYQISYNPKTHEFQELEFDHDQMTEFPKDLILVEFPFQQELDPIGWNRLGGWDLKDDLKQIGLKSHFVATTIPWEKSWLAVIIKENLERMNKQEKKKKTVAPVPSKVQHNKGRKR